MPRALLTWLLDSDPSLRWQVERDLAGEPEDVWRATRSRVAVEGFGARLLSHQDEDGQWAGGGYFPADATKDEPGQPWTATTWSLNALREWGVEAAALRPDAAGLLARNARWEYDDLPYWGGEVDACINAYTLANGGWLGADVSRIVDWFVEHRLPDGGCIAILAPCIYKGQQDKEIPQAPALRADDAKAEMGQRMLRGFRVVHVFDVSQTDGEPLPDVSPALLHGPAPQRLWESLVSLVERESYSLERGDCGGANGFTRFDERLIRIRDDVEPARAAKTLAHEVGHVRAEHETRFMDQYRQSGACRGVAEVEAESIAFLVAASSGLDSSDYTIPYVAGWAGGDVELLKGTASRVVTVARGILDDAGLGAEAQRRLAAPVSRPRLCPTPVEMAACTTGRRVGEREEASCAARGRSGTPMELPGS